MASPWLKQTPKKRDYVAERGLDEFLYLVNPDDLRVHRFEAAGRAVWDMIDGRRSGEELAREYCRRQNTAYVPQLMKPIGGFLDTLRAQDLIYTDDEPQLRRPRVCKQSGEGQNLSEPLETGAGGNMNVVNEMWRRAGSHRTILKCDLELTYACNHACLHCYNPTERRKTLGTSEFLDLIDQLADQGCLFLGFTGGEVFVRPDAMVLARRARERKFSIRFLTNGALIDERLADEIADIHPETVEISLLGTRPETHDHFAQAPGSYQKIMRACRLLAEREVNVYARYVFTRHNVYESPEMPQLADDLGIKYIYQKPHLLPTVDRDMSPTDHRLTNDQIKWLYQKGIWNPTGHSGCYAGVSRASISPWGQIHACEFLPQTVGSIRDDGQLRDIWLASNERKIWDDARVHSPTGCSDCSNQEVCIRCPAIAFLEEGSLTASSSQSCRVSGVLREAEAEMQAPGWMPLDPAARGDTWTNNLTAPVSPPGPQLVTLRVPDRAKKDSTSHN